MWVTDQTNHQGTTYTNGGLKAGDTYYYRVFAVNLAGTGPVSTDVLAQTDFAEAPGTVRSLMARATDQNTIELSWRAPTDDGGADIVRYHIHFASDGQTMLGQVETAVDPTDPGLLHTDGPVTTYDHEDLVAGTRYRYQVYAVNDDNLKSANPGDTEAATTHDLDKPGAPTVLRAVQTDDDSFNLYWYAPADNGGVAISGYRVDVQLSGESSYSTQDPSPWTDTRESSHDALYDLPNASTATSVSFRVYAQTTDPTDAENILTSDRYASTSAKVIAELDTSQAPLLARRIPMAPTFVNDDAERDNFNSVDLEWVAPPSGTMNVAEQAISPSTVSGYRIDVSDDGKAWSSLPNAWNTRKTATEFHYQDSEQKNRFYRIFAWNGQFLGPAQTAPVESTLSIGEATYPGHAEGLTLTVVGPSQIDLSWTVPTDTGNAPIVEYEVQAERQADDGSYSMLTTTEAGADTEGEHFAIVKTTSYSHEGLSAGETWRYRVIPVNESAAETPVKARPEVIGDAEVKEETTDQEAMPNAPEMLVAESAKDSNSEASNELGDLLLWNAPNAPDGANIGGYRVQRMVDDGAWGTLESDTSVTDTDFTDTEEPAMGEMRGYRVAAISTNDILGAWSNVAMIPQDTEPYADLHRVDLTDQRDGHG